MKPGKEPSPTTDVWEALETVEQLYEQYLELSGTARNVEGPDLEVQVPSWDNPLQLVVIPSERGNAFME